MSYFWKNIIFLAIFHFSDVITECPSKNNFPEFVDCTTSNPQNYPVVQINTGKVGGKCEYNQIAKRNVCSWRGIPFAEPPVGNLRFMAPKPPKPFNETYWGLNVGNICVQTVLPFIGSEDCLFANVYVPENCTPAKPCPVMFWIHGGAFVYGSGNTGWFGPDHFMSNDVIVVTFNYRLGPFGFLCTEDANIPGNAGLLDQHLALKWVNKNIAAFGGDAASVTIFGESAGAASVCYHCMSYASAGLFNRVIMQSGDCLNDWAINYKPRDTVLQLATKLGITSTNMTEVTEQLQRVPASVVAAEALILNLEVINPIQITPFTPSIDYQIPKFIADTPRNIASHKLVNNRPICHGAEMISGMDSGDGGVLETFLLLRPTYLAELSSNKETLTLPRCNLQPGSKDSIAVGGKIFDRFFSNNVTEWNFYRYVTSMIFLDGSSTLINAYIDSGKKPFVYYFSYCGGANYGRDILFPGVPCSKETVGAIHADELWYEWTQKGLDLAGLLRVIGLVDKDVTEAIRRQDLKIGNQITRYFSNFAKYGTPNSPPPVNPLLNVNWRPATSTSDIQALNINNTISMIAHPLADDINFWATVCSPN